VSWFLTAKEETETSQLNRRIKDIIRHSSFFSDVFKLYNVPVEKLDNLTFKAKKMNGNYALSNSNEIWLNKKLFEKGDFFTNKMHFVVHELVHWLTRQREKEFYFADPEEHLSFIVSLAYEMLRGIDEKEIAKTFYPIVKDHFSEEKNALAFFKILLKRAKTVKNNIFQLRNDL